METLLDRLSSYNLLNYLLPGVLFLVLVDILDIADIDESNILLMIFVGYFAGMFISRVGSVVIEPWFKKMRIVEYAKYEDFVKAEAKDSKIPTLLSENNLFRTFIALFLILLVLFSICLIPQAKEWLRTPLAKIIVLLLTLVLFIVSYSKQSNYIRKRIEMALKKKV